MRAENFDAVWTPIEESAQAIYRRLDPEGHGFRFVYPDRGKATIRAECDRIHTQEKNVSNNNQYHISKAAPSRRRLLFPPGSNSARHFFGDSFDFSSIVRILPAEARSKLSAGQH